MVRTKRRITSGYVRETGGEGKGAKKSAGVRKNRLTFFGPRVDSLFVERGAVAQLGERLNGIQEVVGSIPSSSTKKNAKGLPRNR